MKIKAADIVICLLYYAIFKIHVIPAIIQQITKILAVVLVLIFLISNLNIKKLFNLSMPFAMSVCISSVAAYLHKINTFGNIFNGILYGVIFYCICTMLIYCREKNYVHKFIDRFYAMTAVYIFFSMVSILLNRPAYDSPAIYFVGNKFATSYLFMLFTVLFGIKYVDLDKGNYTWIYYALSIATVFLSGYIYCSTAVVSSLVLPAIPLIPKTLRKTICNTKGIMLAGSISVLVILIIEIVLNNQQIRYFIRDILRESLTLTGRLQIYKALPKIISERLLLGYGYGNGVVRDAVGYGNAQNGELDMLVNYGIIGCTALLWTIYKCTNKQIENGYWRMYVMTYAMLAASIVEISLGYEFFLSLFVIYAASEQTEFADAKENKGHKFIFSKKKYKIRR